MNRLIKSTALGLSVLMGCSLCACGVTDSSLGQKTEINPGLWVEKEVALEPDPSDILALTTTTDGQLLCATVQSNGEASQKVDVLSSSDGYTWDTTPVYSVEVPGTCIEASLTESGVLVLTRTEDEEQIWYGAKETECSQVQPADSEVTDINNIQFVNSDSFLMAGRDTNNQSVAAIFSLRDGRMVTKVGAGTEWGGFAQHGDELAFISETGKLSTLKANGEIQEGNVEGLENIIAAYCDSQGNYYYADSEGIYRVAAGGTLKEEITPSSGFAFSVQGKVITNLVYFQDSFFCVVKDTSDDSAQLYSYTFDPDATPSEQIELTVWSLSDSPTVRRVLSEYQQQHNDIAIQYTVAGSDDLATEDVLKALNTELLAGSGPDLIVFDGIDVTPYIENGVLADLNESLQEFSILDSIKNAFSVDGKTYIAAARYAIPSIWGTADDMDQITDLSSFIEFVKSCPSRDDYNLSDNAYYTALPEEDKYAASFMTPQEILQFLMSTSASELITDNTLNQEQLQQLFQAIESIGTYYNMASYRTEQEDDSIVYSDGGDSITISGASREVINKRARIGRNLIDSPAFLGWITKNWEGQAPELKSAPGLCERAYSPKVLLGINASSPNQEAAKDLLRAYEADQKAYEELEKLRASENPDPEAISTAEQAADDAHWAAQQAEYDRNSALASYQEMQRQNNLSAQVNQASAEDVALDIKDTQAEIEQLEQLVNQQGVISSPFSGVISNVEAEVGTESTQTFCTIYDTSKGYLFACELPAAQASDCQTGLSAVIKQGDQTETAAITAISENAENDTVDITIQLTATDWKVGPADAEIVLSEQDYDLCLPNTAIHQDNQGDFVFAVEEKNTVLGTQNVLVRIPVTVLEVGQSQTSIEGAILPEDSIVVQSTRSLEAGSKVRVKNENA